MPNYTPKPFLDRYFYRKTIGTLTHKSGLHWTVVDQRDDIEVCRCFTEDQAKLIVEALNAYVKNNS